MKPTELSVEERVFFDAALRLAELETEALRPSFGPGESWFDRLRSAKGQFSRAYRALVASEAK